MRRNLICLLSILWGFNGFPQSITPSNVQHPALAKLTMQSPKAAALQRFGDYPISHFTGMVDVSVPIDRIEINGIVVPIEFKYDASGSRYDDVDAELGLRWTLMAGGMISQIINGIPDGGNFFAKLADQLNTTADSEPGTWGEITEHKKLMFMMESSRIFDSNDTPLYDYTGYDGERDIYHYTLPTRSGKFIVDQGEAVPIPYAPISIYPDRANPEIMDENGIRYFFRGYVTRNEERNKEFYLQMIVSADKRDTVRFSYKTPVNSYLFKPYNDRYYVHTYTTNRETWTNESKEIETGGPNSTRYFPPVLQSITCRGHKVEFDSGTGYGLKNIKIYDGSTLIRTISMTYSGSQMTKIGFYGQNGVFLYNYQFEYNPCNISPNDGFDYWGYYNGRSNYLPKYSVSYDKYVDVNIDDYGRQPNASVAQQGILSRVVYPTKGYTKFYYEGHKAYIDGRDNFPREVGGLRIQKIVNYSESDEVLETKIYKYGSKAENPESSYGIIGYYPEGKDFITSTKELVRVISNYDKLEYLIESTRIDAFPANSYYTTEGRPVYPYVTEYLADASGANGKTVYKYSYTAPDAGRSTKFLYNRPGHYMRDYGWKNGNLVEKTIYDAAGNVKYRLSNEYKTINSREFLNLKVLPYIRFRNEGYQHSSPGYMFSYTIDQCIFGYNLFYPRGNWSYGDFLGSSYTSVYDLYNYYNVTGLMVLESSTETTDGVAKTTTYSDYNSYGMPGKISQTTSEGDVLSYVYKYADNATAGYVPAYFPFRTKPIEQWDYFNSTLMRGIRTRYTSGNNGNSYFYAPSEEEYIYGNSAPQTRIQYHKYDQYGNPVYITKDGTQHIVYIWSYEGRYPVFKIENATYNQVEAILGRDVIASMNKNPAPIDKQTYIRGNSLRTGLPSAQVSVYIYKPSVGILAEVNPTGNGTTYTYDAHGRLESIKDSKNNFVQQFEYGYKN